jgi:hypothetical protein
LRPGAAPEESLAALETAFRSTAAVRSYGYRFAVQRGFLRLARTTPATAAAVRSKLRMLAKEGSFTSHLSAWRTLRMIEADRHDLPWDPHGSVVTRPD